METITLFNGQKAIIDDDLLSQLSKFTWSLDSYGYAKKMFNGRVSYLHYYVIGHPIRGFTIDHINHDKLDNRRVNLRLVPRGVNCQHRKRTNKAGFLGVQLNGKRYQATINKRGLGTFNTAEEAARVYDQHALAYHGEQAKLNFPEESRALFVFNREREALKNLT